MKKTNLQFFEELNEHQFFKTTEKAARHFRAATLPPNSIGFHPESNGFLTVHRKHEVGGLNQEIPACLILKNLGFAVVLLDEESSQRTPDVRIGEVIFEIKQVAEAKRLHRAIHRHFKVARAQSQNLLLHIAQSVSPEQLRYGLFFAAKEYPHIKLVWVIFANRLFQFDTHQILKGKHQFK